MRRMNYLIILLGLPLAALMLVSACDDKETNNRSPAQDSLLKLKNIDSEKVAAIVDGHPILLDDVKFLLNDKDLGLTLEQAVEKLIEQQLLANEAAHRGYATHFDVIAERKKALVRGLLDKISKKISAQDVDNNLIRERYEKKKKTYVHSKLRRVIHIVARTGAKNAKKNKGFKNETDAEDVARQIAESVRDVTDLAEFIKIVEFFKMEHGKRLKIETLPPFSKTNTGFAPEFVEAAFSVEGPGHTSDAFKTTFGWHVLFAIEDLPPENIKFEEVRDNLAQELIPLKKKKTFDEIMTRVLNKTDTFIYEKNLALQGTEK